MLAVEKDAFSRGLEEDVGVNVYGLGARGIATKASKKS